MPQPQQKSEGDLSHWDAPSHWRWFVIPFAGCLLAAALLNVWVNPFALYGDRGYQQMVPNYRQLKLEMVARLDPAPTTLVLGSSRAMKVPPGKVESYLEGTTFNFGLKGGKMEDSYSALRLVVDELGLPIQNLVLALDHAAFNAAVPLVAESKNNPDYSRFLIHHDGNIPVAHGAVPMLISMEQTISSARVLRDVARGLNPDERLEPQGQRVRGSKDSLVEAGTYDLAGILDKRVRMQPISGMRMPEFSEVDPLGLAYLDSLLAFCEDHSIEVYPYFTTYHPRQLEVLDSFPNRDILGQVVDAVAATLDEHGIELRDYTEVDSFGGSPDLFYDEVHMRPENEELLIDHLLGREVHQP